MMKNLLLTLSIFFICLKINAQDHSFETTVPTNWSSQSGSLNISDERYIDGSHSLKWDWIGGDTLVVDTPNIDPTLVLQFYHHTLWFWTYNETAGSDTLKLEFLDANGVVNYHFDILLNFEGWRRIVRSYKYDMYAISGVTTDIAKVNIIAPSSGSGNLFIDELMYTRARVGRIKNRYMPDIHGYLSNDYYFRTDTISPNVSLTTPTSNELTELNEVRAHMLNLFKGGPPNASAISNAVNFYNGLNIVKSGGTIKGKHTTPQNADPYLIHFARDYYHNGTSSSLEKAEDIIWLIHDGGYAAGSDLTYGWYDTRNYFTGLLLIYPYLSANNQTKIYDAVQWVLRGNEIWEADPPNPGYDSDYVHTNLRFLLGAIAICINDDQLAIQHLKGFKQYLEVKNKFGNSTRGWLKADGSSFHHGTHYNAYMYAFTSYVTVLSALDSTQYQIDSTAYVAFRDAAYSLLIMCNGKQFANSLSGRHPFSTNLPMAESAYARLAKLGGFILEQAVDTLIAGAYNRAFGNDPTLASYPTEDFPEGFWQYNYSPIGIYRKDNWVATMHGMNKTFWGTEIYITSNRYGIYQSYGAVEIMYPGGRAGSGMSKPGYDWNKPPGTTSRVLPWAELNPTYGRWDERSDLDYAAALRFDKMEDGIKGNQGNMGLYAIHFKQKTTASPSHQGELEFKKTMFCFDDMILCLGSDIKCNDTNNEIITTIFQNSLPTTSTATTLNGTEESSFPYSNQLTDTNWLMDAWTTGYYVKSADSLTITRANQSSPDQSGNNTFASGDFASAWIKHGAAPNSKSYEFVIKPNTSAAEMANFASSMEDSTTVPYTIIQQDEIAHIVKHKASGTIAHAFFQPYLAPLGLTDETISNSSILEVDQASMIALRNENDSLIISVVDPSTSYAQKDKIQVRLSGGYAITSGSENVSLVSANVNETILEFTPEDGQPIDVLMELDMSLPVELSHFSVSNAACTNLITWTTAVEENFAYFDLEKSNDGQHFEILTQVATKGGQFEQQYKFEDQDGGTINYYRLKMVDKDRSYEYSNTVAVRSTCTETSVFHLYPNPADINIGQINIQLYCQAKQQTIVVRDQMGRLMQRNKINLTQGWNTIKYDISNLEPGAYMIYTEENPTKQFAKFFLLE